MRVLSKTGLTAAGLLALAGVAQAQSVDLGTIAPEFDLWMYGTAGGAAAFASPIFAAPFQTDDPDRLGFYHVAFDVDGLLPTGGPWRVSSAVLSVYMLNGSTFDPSNGPLYDNTYDSQMSYLDGSDEDPGRPIELYGSQLPMGLTYDDWRANGLPVFSQGEYSTLPMDFDKNGDERSVQNSVDDGFDTNPWAIATTDDTNTQGGVVRISEDALLMFELDVTDPNINAYLMDGLLHGWIGLNVSSLHVAGQPGVDPNADVYPRLATMESFGLPDPSLSIVLEPAPVGCGVADTTTDGTNPGDAGYGAADGVVSVTDLTYLVEQWVIGNASEADLTTDGTNPGDADFGVPDGNVTVTDLTYFVELWIAGCPG